MKHIVVLIFIAGSHFFGKIMAQDLVRISEGQNFGFTEGPVWDGNQNFYFTDIPNSAIIRYDVDSKQFSTITSASNEANGLMFTKDNNLAVCEGGKGRLTLRSTEGEVVDVLTDTFKGKRYNKTNDLCVDARGGIYFTDPTWEKEVIQGIQGVYYRNPSGEVSLLFGDFQRPNGIILSPDGQTLYVNDSWGKEVRAYDVDSQGGISNPKTFVVLDTEPASDTRSGADGMAVDVEGTLYITTKLGVQIVDKNGKKLRTIAVPEAPTNCTFGGKDMKTLFITARENVYTLDVSVRGFRHPFDLSSTLSVPDLEPDVQFQITPNPAKSGEYVEISNEEMMSTASEVAWYSLKGQQVGGSTVKSSIRTNRLAVPFLQSGTYLVTLRENGHNSVTKVVIE